MSGKQSGHHKKTGQLRARARVQLQPYAYKPLAAGEIRILTLFPGQYANPLRGSLKAVLLSEKPCYKAISYVWGEPDFRESISMSGHGELKTTTSLHGALQRFRDPKTPVRLWADALCINQSCVEERDQQVQLMGEVYSGASDVLVWLGEPDDCDDLAFWTINHLPSVWHSTPSPGPVSNATDWPLEIEDRFRRLLNDQHRLLAPHLDRLSGMSTMQAAFFAVKSVFDRQYFQRLWPVQEVLLARSVIVYAGTLSCTWENLEETSGMCNRIHEEREGYVRLPNTPLIMLLNGRNSAESGQAWSLHTLLLETMTLKASEIKDHLFALRAIVAEVDRPALYGSYSDKTLDLFRRLTLHLLQQTPPAKTWPQMSPSCMLAVAAAQNSHDVTKSSWILDCSSAHDLWVPPEYYIAESDARFHRIRANWMPEDPLTLRLSGLRIAVITSLMNETRSTDTLMAEACYVATRETPDEAADEALAEETLYKLCVRFCHSRCTNEVPPRGPLADMFFAETEEDIVRLCNRQISRHRHSEAHTNWAASVALHLRGVRPQQRWFPWREPRQSTLSYLSDGRLGWVPNMASAGDSVVLIQGAPRPFIMRRMSEDSFRLVGDAEVPGMKFRENMAADWSEAEELKIL